MATVKVLIEGRVASENRGRSWATCSLVRDGTAVMVVDPGFGPDNNHLIKALAQEGLQPERITMVGITQASVSHSRSVGLFTNADIVDWLGIWHPDGSREEWGQMRAFGAIKPVRTPGHDNDSITFFVETNDGVAAICGDVFWKEHYPEVDPYASDLQALGRSRSLVLESAHWIIPGHGPMFKTGNGLPKQLQQRTVQEEPPALGKCKKCGQLFLQASDHCICQPDLCYHCCECEADCLVCNCKERL